MFQLRTKLLLFGSLASMLCSCRSALRQTPSPEEQLVRRGDGSLIDWSLDRQRALPKQGVLLLARDASGTSHLDEVLKRISAWLSARVTPPFADPCAREGAAPTN